MKRKSIVIFCVCAFVCLFAVILDKLRGAFQPILPTSFLIAETPGRINLATKNPGVAFDGTRYLVVWDQRPGADGTGTGIFGQFIDKSGQLSGPRLTIASRLNLYNPSIAFNGTHFLVVYRDSCGIIPTRETINARIISTTGEIIGDEHIISPEDWGSTFYYDYDLAYDGTRFLFVGTVWISGANEIIGQFVCVDEGGQFSLFGEDFIISSSGVSGVCNRDPKVAFGESNYFVVWAYQPYSNGPMDIQGAFVDLNGSVSPTYPVTSLPGYQWRQDLSYGGGNFVVGFVDYGADWGSMTMYATRISPGGLILDGTAETGGIVINDSITWESVSIEEGNGYWLFVGEHWSACKGVRLSFDGLVIDPAPVQFMTELIEKNPPGLTFDGNNFLVATVLRGRLQIQGQIIGPILRAQDDEFSTEQDVTIEIQAPGVLANDDYSDGNNPILLDIITYPTNGNLEFSAEGSFTYQPFPGFSGIDQFNYKIISGTLESNPATVTITVNRTSVPPSIDWPTPADIVYETPLSSIQLNATVEYMGQPVPGTYTYNPPAGTILAAGQGQLLTVIFTPNDPGSYEEVTADVRINVLQAVPIIEWAPPANIIYSTPLGLSELNAIANHMSHPVDGTFDYNPRSGTVLNAGQTMLYATFNPADPANYASGSAQVMITVDKAMPTIEWPQPPDIEYGMLLEPWHYGTAVHFNGNPIQGGFEWVPGPGIMLDAGPATLETLFHPNDQTNFEIAHATRTINVSKATPIVTWPDPADIVYGTALSPTQLNASASVDGSFAYSPAAGTVLGAGSHNLSVTFTPAIFGNYNTVTMTAHINVMKAVPTIDWPDPADIVYGTALGAAQLNATSPVTGSFRYTPYEGIVLNAGQGQPLSVIFYPQDTVNYEQNSAQTTINVLQATPVITWAPPATITYPTPLSEFQLSAEASVAGSFTYSHTIGDVLDAGSYLITASFTSMDPNYQGGTAQATLTVLQGMPVITWAPPADITYGTALSVTQLNATASMAGEYIYTPAAGEVLSAGSHQLTVTFTPADSANYANASTSVTLTVNQATPTVNWGPPADITYGTALSVTQLNATASMAGDYIYTPAAGEVLNAGSGQTLHVDFTPTDTTNYGPASMEVFINVTPAPLTIKADDKSKSYGTDLPAFTATYAGFVPGQDESVLGGSLILSTSATAASPVGTYAISPSGQTSTNYSISYIEGILSVNPAPLNIKADDSVKILGAPLPAFSASYFGFVPGEGPGVLSGTLVFQTEASASSPVGTYPVTPSGLTSSNYTISYEAGNLSVLYAPHGTCLDGHVILPPIDADGTSVFKKGRTVPAKFKVFDANCVSIGTPGVVADFKIVQIISGTVSDAVDETVYSTTPDAVFRWSPVEALWIFNISTDNLSANKTYVFRITLNDGSIIEFLFGVR